MTKGCSILLYMVLLVIVLAMINLGTLFFTIPLLFAGLVLLGHAV